MGLQKIRADFSEVQADGATVWSAQWMGGPSLAKIDKCRWESLHGEPRVTVYVQGEADTFFSIPAKTRYLGKIIKGYLTCDDDGNLVFRHVLYM